MINDEMLKAAAGKADEALVKALQDMPDYEHQFSKRFERRMNRIIRREKYKTVYKFCKAAACFLLITALSGATLLAVNSEARAAFIGWAKETYESIIEYHFNGTVSDDTVDNIELAEYRLGWIPEGYEEKFVNQGQTSALVLYGDSTNKLLKLEYFATTQDTNYFFIDTDKYDHFSDNIKETYADIYISKDPAESNIIIWSDNEEATLFSISGFFDKEILIKMAEDVILSDKK